MTQDEIKKKFSDAFSEMENDLKTTKQELTEKIEQFIESEKQKSKDSKPLYLINTPESRIKDKDHFWGKLVRNGYIEKWKPNEDSDYKALLRNNLSDLIGLRILCYFEIDEEIIFNNLNIFLKSDPSFSDLHIDNVNKTIKGTLSEDHVYINKIQGKFKNKKSIEYCFEIQIKSLVNDLWGEVDHEIIYKARQYQYDSEATKELSTSIHKNLLTSDHQLHEMLKRTYKEEQLINSLFFLETENRSFGINKYDNLNHVYHQFFNFFNTDEDKSQIKKFVGSFLLNESVSLEPIIPKIENIPIVVFFAEKVLAPYFVADLQAIKGIAANIYKYDDDNIFLFNIATNLFQEYLDVLQTTNEDIDDDTDDDTEGEERVNENEYEVESQLLSLSTVKNDQQLIERFSKTFGGIEMLPDFKNFSMSEKTQIKTSYINLVKNLTEEK